MECGLSSIPTTQDRDRPTDLRHYHHTRKEMRRQLKSTVLKIGILLEFSLKDIKIGAATQTVEMMELS